MDMIETWDDLAKTDEEKKLLAKVRRIKIGKIASDDYENDDFLDDDDDFNEVINRVEYLCDLQEEYWDLGDVWDSRVTKAHIKTARKWVAEAKRCMMKKRN